MAIADPQSVTIGGVANSLPRTGSGDNHGVFTKDDRTVALKVTHSPNKTRVRRSVRLDFSKIAADPPACRGKPRSIDVGFCQHRCTTCGSDRH